MNTNTNVDLGSLIKFIENENNAEYSFYSSEVNSPLSKLCDNFSVLGPILIKSQLTPNRVILQGKHFYYKFRPGDRVEIRTRKSNSDLSSNVSYNWMVEDIFYPAPGTIEIMISSEHPTELDSKKEYFLFNSLNINFNKLMIKKLADTASKQPVLGSGLYHLDLKNPTFKKLFDELNWSQKRAIEYLYDHNLSGAIQGPPGTGKTQLLKAVLRLALNANMTVAIASFTNAAVDNLLGRWVHFESSENWLRISKPEKVKKDLYPNQTDFNSRIANTFPTGETDFSVIGTTLHKLALNSRAPRFDLLLIDEAGQVPVYFWPFIQRLANRVIMVGDQFQLPPISKNSEYNLPFESTFSLVYDSNTPMLETQYRMRKEIQTWSSEKFYQGKLQAHPSVEQRDFFQDSKAFANDRIVNSKSFTSGDFGKSSKYEAEFVSSKIYQVIKNGVDSKHVGVICPYRVQAGAVIASLQNTLGVELASKIMVDTVERFQGQEKEAIFLSLGASGKDLSELEFLSDIRRLNVSVTRARSRFFCVYEKDLLENADRRNVYDLKEFLSWINDGSTPIRRAA